MSLPLTSFLRDSASSQVERGYAYYRDLGTKIADGSLGREAQCAFRGRVTTFAPLPTSQKVAVADDSVHESDEDARKRRLGEILRRRQRSGLATGDATPTPPRDNKL